MKFGKLPDEEIDGVDFTLPQDHSETTRILADLPSNGEAPKVYVGCAKWGRKEWVGLIYPSGTKDKDFLDHYVQQFNGIELNTTFYSIKKANVERWASKAGDGFKFCPKFSQTITHMKRLKDIQDMTDYYLEACHAFGDRLGTTFLQLPDNFSPKKFNDLQNYISELPEDFPVTVELRHTSWFTDPVVFDETFSMLESYGKGAVITDTAGRRDCVHQRLTMNSVFVRFNGYNLHPSDFTRIDDWVTRIKTWLNNGLKEVYFFIHQEDETNSPKTCEYVIEKLNKECGLNLKPPVFQTGGLFD